MPARNTYLSGTVAPLVRTTLRRLRLDFGDELFHKNDELAINGASYQGDDYNDPVNVGPVVWGDSCVTDVSGRKVRVIGQAAWPGFASNALWYSYSTVASDDWSLSSLTAPTSIAPGCRLGAYPKPGTDAVYVWYVSVGGDLYRSTLSTSGWGFAETSTPSGFIGSASGIALHPVSADTCILVGFNSTHLWAKVYTWNGSAWTSTPRWIIHVSDELEWPDAQWSDAEVNPIDATKYVLAVNLNKWGSAHTVIYDTQSGLWSQPREILPSAEQWGNLKVKVSGMSVINSRIWAVTVRETVASNNIQMAHHVALASSADGIHWRDEYFVTQSTLRGKLL